MFANIGSSHGMDLAAFSQAQVKEERKLGILLSTVLLSAGAFVLRESTANPQSCTASYILTGATVSAIGLITGSWAIQRHLFIRRLEQHARGDQ
jgi:hypothetical protein